MLTKNKITIAKAKVLINKAGANNSGLFQAMDIYHSKVEEVKLHGLVRVAVIVTVGTRRLLIHLQSDAQCGLLNRQLDQAFRKLII